MPRIVNATMVREAFRQCLRRVLQLLLFSTVAFFFVYLSAISLSAWWLSSAQGALGSHLEFPYLSAYVGKRFDKADKFFVFPLPQDLAVAVRASLFSKHLLSCSNVLLK